MKLDRFDNSVSLMLGIGMVGFVFGGSYWLVAHQLAPQWVADLINVFGLLVVSIFLGRMIALLWPLEPGLYSTTESSTQVRVWKQLGFLNGFNLTFWINTGILAPPLRTLVYRGLGCRIGRNAMLAGKIIEPLMVSVGDDALLGENSLVSGHTMVGSQLKLARVCIGNRVTIGGGAIIMPDVEIGDDAVVAAGSVVSMGSRIPANEIWGGVPAKKIAMRDLDVGATVQIRAA